MNKPAVQVHNLKFGYSKNTLALDGVSFKIQEGTYNCILGHNGSGKSTLSKLLMGILLPSEGTISFFEKDFNEKTFTSLRKHLGIVFQNPDNQFIGNSVEDDIAFGLENRCIPSEKMYDIILNAAKAVKLEHKLKSKPEYLSGGQKQKVAIASTIALNTNILIFDEVTSMLDPSSKKEVNSLMLEMVQKHKKTVISITHNMDEALKADKIFVLEKGKLVLSGTPKEIFKDKNLLKQYKLDLPFPIALSSAIQENKKNFKIVDSIEKIVEQLCK